MSEPHVFVRPATALDAPTLGEIHAQTMRASVCAAVGDLPHDVTSGINASMFADSWSQAITAPPGPDFSVLVAVEDGNVVGFVAFVPARAVGSANSAESEIPGKVTEIVSLEVRPHVQRHGHGSRLLAAAVDTCRERGVTHLQTWILMGDDSRTSFLTSAGFAPAGLRRNLAIGHSNATEHCWYTQL